ARGRPRALGRRLRDLGRLDRRGDRALGDLGAARPAYGRGLHGGSEQGARAPVRRADRPGRRAPRAQPNVPGRRASAALVGRGAAHPRRHDLEADRMNALAALRAARLAWPPFLHVLGGMILVGGLVAGVGALGLARGDVRFLRLGYWSLLLVSLPGWVLMRVGGRWISSKEGWDDLPAGASKPGWLNTGMLIADVGGLVLLGALVVGGAGIYRLRQGGGAGLVKAALVVSVVLLA